MTNLWRKISDSNIAKELKNAATHLLRARRLKSRTNAFVPVASIGEQSENFSLRQQLFVANQALDFERQSIAMLMAKAPAFVAICRGPELRFETVSAQYAALLGNKSVIGQSMAEAERDLGTVPLADIIRHACASGGQVTDHEMSMRCVDPESGKTKGVFLDVTATPIDGVGGHVSGVFLFAYDVSTKVCARKQSERRQARLARSLDAAREEQRLHELNIAALTHDMRTPLTAAKLTADSLHRRSFRVDSVRAKATTISQNLTRASRMIQDCLDAKRLNFGEGLQVFLQPCATHELMDSVVKGCQASYGPRVKLTKVDPMQVYWDPDAVQRIVENLSSNAIKYGAADTDVTVGCQTDAHGVELWVHNEGGAVISEDVQNMFQPYKRAPRAVSDGKVGWGLGLSVVEELTKAHGGTVRVVSEPNQGTTFRVRMPTDARRNLVEKTS